LNRIINKKIQLLLVKNYYCQRTCFILVASVAS